MESEVLQTVLDEIENIKLRKASERDARIMSNFYWVVFVLFFILIFLLDYTNNNTIVEDFTIAVGALLAWLSIGRLINTKR